MDEYDKIIIFGGLTLVFVMLSAHAKKIYYADRSGQTKLRAYGDIN